MTSSPLVCFPSSLFLFYSYSISPIHFCSSHLLFSLGPLGHSREGWFSLRLCFDLAGCTPGHFYLKGLKTVLKAQGISEAQCGPCLGRWSGVWGGMEVNVPFLSSVCSEGQLGFLYLLPSYFLGLYFPQYITFIHEVVQSTNQYLSFSILSQALCYSLGK